MAGKKMAVGGMSLYQLYSYPSSVRVTICRLYVGRADFSVWTPRRLDRRCQTSCVGSGCGQGSAQALQGTDMRSYDRRTVSDKKSKTQKQAIGPL